MLRFIFKKDQPGQQELILNKEPKTLLDYYQIAGILADVEVDPSLYVGIAGLEEETNEDKVKLARYKLAREIFKYIIDSAQAEESVKFEAKKEDVQPKNSENEEDYSESEDEGELTGDDLVTIVEWRLQNLESNISDLQGQIFADHFELKLELKENNPLEDFPRSEHWRLMTDGWQQAHGGYVDFKPEYYMGVLSGFECMKPYLCEGKEIDAQLIEVLHDQILQYELKEKEDQALHVGFRAKRGMVKFGLGPGPIGRMGVSADGLDELILAEELAATENRWRLIDIDRGTNSQAAFDMVKADRKEEDRSKRKADLLATINNTNNKFLIIVGLAKLDIKQIRNFIQRDLAVLYSGLKLLDESNRKKKIALIVQFIRTLNQNHWFLDGNGRTCIMLLQLLLMRHLKTMAIIPIPAHFTGYSTEGLVLDIENGIKEFNKYKITEAKQLILAEKKFDQSIFEKALPEKLANEPHIAMAQINELYMQIKENKIPIANSGQKQQVLDFLKKLYEIKLREFAENAPPDPSQKLIEKSYDKMLQLQEISKDIDQGIKAQMKVLYFKKPDQTNVFQFSAF